MSRSGETVIVGLGVLAASVGCGDSSSSSSSARSSGSASVTGHVSGASFAAADAMSASFALPNSGTPPAQEFAIVLTSFAGVCGASSLPTNAAAVSIVMLTGTVSPGTYPIDGQGVEVSFEAKPGSSCQTYGWATANGAATTSTLAQEFAEAMGGTVTLTTVGAETVTGSFTATFGSGDTLTGSFTAPSCNSANLSFGKGC